MGEWGEGELDNDSQKVQTSSSKISTRDVMYNMINIINTAYVIYIKVVKNSHHKEKIFSFYFNFVSLYMR